MALAAQTNDVIGMMSFAVGNPGAAMEREMKDWLRRTYGVAIDKSKNLRAHSHYKFLAAEPDGISNI